MYVNDAFKYEILKVIKKIKICTLIFTKLAVNKIWQCSPFLTLFYFIVTQLFIYLSLFKWNKLSFFSPSEDLWKQKKKMHVNYNCTIYIYFLYDIMKVAS